TEILRQHLRVVGSRLERAAVVAECLDIGRDGETAPDMLGWSIHDPPRPILPRGLADPASDPFGDLVIRGQRARAEPGTRWKPRDHAVDAERSPVIAVEIPGEEIPALTV